MENVLCLLEVEGPFFAGFSILSFLSFVQWALTRASINAFWIHKPNGLFHTINIWEMQLRYLSTALKVFAHFSVHVCSRWSLIMLIDANYFQTLFWLKNRSHSLGICCFQLRLLFFSGKENEYCLLSFSTLKSVIWDIFACLCDRGFQLKTWTTTAWGCWRRWTPALM